MHLNPTTLKWWLAIFASMFTFLEPTFPIIAFCFLMICFDCWSAYRLSRRVKKKTGKGSGKFRSEKARNVWETIIQMLLIVILAYFAEIKVFVMYKDLYLANYAAGIFSVTQIWSILENESSMNDNPFAKALQRIMVDKAERHFDIDLHEFKDNANATN